MNSEPTDPLAARLSQVLRRAPRLTLGLVGGDREAAVKLPSLVAAAGLRGLFILVCDSTDICPPTDIELSFLLKNGAPAILPRDMLVIATYYGAVGALIAELRTWEAYVDWIVLWRHERFSQTIDALGRSPIDESTTDTDFTVLTEDRNFLQRVFQKNRISYIRFVNLSSAMIADNVIHFCRQVPINHWVHGLMLAVRGHDGLQYRMAGAATAHGRIPSTVSYMNRLLPSVDQSKIDSPWTLIIQYTDHAVYDIGSIAYGREQNASTAIRLIPDPYFSYHNGYQKLRDAVLEGRLPPWEQRKSAVFWRGSATTNYVAADGSPVERIEQVPRVAMCLILKDDPRADAAIMSPWALSFIPPTEAKDWLVRKEIFRPLVEMTRHADYRFLIDIDGAANAWSFFEKLLLGSCVVKVQSAFEQWFYGEIAAWRHFVPVASDLSDLTEKLDWCLQNQDEARAIGERGQEFAMRHTYAVAMQAALDAVKWSIVRL